MSLQLDAIAVGYGQKIVAASSQRIVLCSAPGESSITLLYGPNGSGKSTLLRSVAGLLPLLHGEARWQGLEHTTALGAGRIRYWADRLEFHPLMTVQRILEYWRPRRIPSKNLAQSRWQEAARRLELPLTTVYRKLSNGQKQKLRLAMLIGQSELAGLTLADEPFSGLDRESRTEAIQLLGQHFKGPEHRLLVCLHEDNLPLGWAQNRLRCEAGHLYLETAGTSVAEESVKGR